MTETNSEYDQPVFNASPMIPLSLLSRVEVGLVTEP